ncbi:hypothetical protein GGTG_04885, partial [Gaeumannomyces tritici R3-111a-1]
LKLLRRLLFLFFFFFFFSFAAVRVTAQIALNVIISEFALNAFGIAIKSAVKVPLIVAISISGSKVSKDRSFFGLVVTFTLYRRKVIAFSGPYKAVIRIVYT